MFFFNTYKIIIYYIVCYCIEIVIIPNDIQIGLLFFQTGLKFSKDTHEYTRITNKEGST